MEERINCCWTFYKVLFHHHAGFLESIAHLVLCWMRALKTEGLVSQWWQRIEMWCETLDYSLMFAFLSFPSKLLQAVIGNVLLYIIIIFYVHTHSLCLSLSLSLFIGKESTYTIHTQKVQSKVLNYVNDVFTFQCLYLTKYNTHKHTQSEHRLLITWQ